MIPVLDMRRFYPYDLEGDYVEPDVRHQIDGDHGDLLEVTYTEQGWVASRHIANPAAGESDLMYWTPANTKESQVVALLECGPAHLLDTDGAHLNLAKLVENALTPIAFRQRLPIPTLLRMAIRPVEADCRPSTRDRSDNRTDGFWEDVNGSSGSSMRPTGGTFVVHRRMAGGLITNVRVTANPTYDDVALEKILGAIDE